jgi:hypothetical protein
MTETVRELGRRKDREQPRTEPIVCCGTSYPTWESFGLHWERHVTGAKT